MRNDPWRRLEIEAPIKFEDLSLGVDDEAHDHSHVDDGAHDPANENNEEIGKDLAESDSPSEAESLDNEYLEECP